MQSPHTHGHASLTTSNMRSSPTVETSNLNPYGRATGGGTSSSFSSPLHRGGRESDENENDDEQQQQQQNGASGFGTGFVDRVTATKTLEIIQRQCHIVASTGASVRQFAAPNGDIVVVIEENAISTASHHAQRYQARIRFVGSGANLVASSISSPSSSSSSSSPSSYPTSPTPITTSSNTTTMSPTSSPSSRLTNKNRRTIFEIEDELNLSFITELYRVLPDGKTTKHVRSWPFSADGRCTIQAPPIHSGRGWGLDALPFVHQWLFRSDPLLMMGDAVDFTLRRVIDETVTMYNTVLQANAVFQKLEENAQQTREKLLQVTQLMLESSTPKEVAVHVPEFVGLLVEADARTLMDIRALNAVRSEGGLSLTSPVTTVDEFLRNDDDEQNEEEDAAHAASGGGGDDADNDVIEGTGIALKRGQRRMKDPTGRGKSSTIQRGIPPFLTKKVRKPNIIWRYEFHPVPIPVHAFASLGRYPDASWKLFDQKVETALWYALGLLDPPPHNPTASEAQTDHEEAKEAAATHRKTEATQAKTFSPRRSKVALVRTIHVPLPIPVVQVAVVNPAVHRLVPQRSYMANIQNLNDTSLARKEDQKLPPLWRGHMHWKFQVRNDTGQVEPCAVLETGLEPLPNNNKNVTTTSNSNRSSSSSSSSSTGSGSGSGSGSSTASMLHQQQPLPVSFPPTGPQVLKHGRQTPVPKLARVHYHLSAGTFATEAHAEALKEWRRLCHLPIPTLPQPWVEDQVWIPPGSAVDTATMTAVAVAVSYVLKAASDPKALLPHGYGHPLVFGNSKTQKDEVAETAAEEGKEDGAAGAGAGAGAATDSSPKTIKKQVSLSSLSSSSSSSANKSLSLFKKNTSKADEEAEAQRQKNLRKGLAAEPPPPPTQWNFMDEIGAFSSGLWYGLAIARGDPLWMYTPPSTGFRFEQSLPKHTQAVALQIRENVLARIRKDAFGNAGIPLPSSSSSSPSSPKKQQSLISRYVSHTTAAGNEGGGGLGSGPLGAGGGVMAVGGRGLEDGGHLFRGYDESFVVPVVKGVTKAAKDQISTDSPLKAALFGSV